MKKFKSSFAVFLATFVTMSLTHCGKTNPADLAGSIPAFACGAGSFPVGSSCVPGYGFNDACFNNGGNIQTVNGTTVCRIGMQIYGPTIIGSAVILNPSNPLGPYSVNTNFVVYPGDRVQIAAAGGWDYKNIWDQHCHNTGLNGFNDNDQGVRTNEGQPQGLFASDGVEAFYVGFSINKVIKNRGYLRFGINATYDKIGVCSDIEINSITVIRCNDISGNTYTCS